MTSIGRPPGQPQAAWTAPTVAAATSDEELYPRVTGTGDESTFTGTAQTSTDGANPKSASLTAAARNARAQSQLTVDELAKGVSGTSSALADPSKILVNGAVTLGMAKRAIDGIADTNAGKRIADSLGAAKALGEKGSARAGVVTNSLSAAANVIAYGKTGDTRAVARAGTDTLYAAGSTYDTLSQKNPAIAQHWVVGSRYFAAASLANVARTAADTTVSAVNVAANPNAENGKQLMNDAGKLSGSTGAASFTVSGAKNATAGAIAKKTGEEFAVVAARVLPKALDTALNVAVKRAPVLFAAADLARVARVSSDDKSHPMKTTLAWVAVGGSAIATLGMLTANPVLIAAGGVVSLAAGTASDVLDR